jgi:hypothetical protein
MADKSLVECMSVNENNRKNILSLMNNKDICCHKGCNLCCHAFTLTVDTLNSYILYRVFRSIPYDELFPYYKKYVENRNRAQEYIDLKPIEENQNIILETYNALGFTPFSCPFVDGQNGCLIHAFNPQLCFAYFSTKQCKIVMNPELSNEQKMSLDMKMKERHSTGEYSGLENDSKDYRFEDIISKTYTKFKDFDKTLRQDIELQQYISRNIMLEMLTIVSFALSASNYEKYEKDRKGLDISLLSYNDGEINYVKG